MLERSDHADSGWDDTRERVLRNEGRLGGLEVLVSQTRASDGKLIDQRSDSLAQELERRAESLLELVTARANAVLDLGKEERRGDRREVELLTTEGEKRTDLGLRLLRELQDTALRLNFEQSREAISALEQRRQAAHGQLEQMVRQWRDSDKEARDLFSRELDKHLDALNHNNERMAAFQANSVTRELWQSDRDAAINREGLIRDQIIALDRVVLTMTPMAASDRAHAEISDKINLAVAAASNVLENKIDVVSEKVADLKTYRDTTSGRSSGYTAVYGWGIAAVTVLISIIVLANVFLSR